MTRGNRKKNIPQFSFPLFTAVPLHNCPNVQFRDRLSRSLGPLLSAVQCTLSVRV